MAGLGGDNGVKATWQKLKHYEHPSESQPLALVQRLLSLLHSPNIKRHVASGISAHTDAVKVIPFSVAIPGTGIAHEDERDDSPSYAKAGDRRGSESAQYLG